MCTLLKLPEHFLSSVIVDWLELQDVIKMERAFSNGSERDLFRSFMCQLPRPLSSARVMKVTRGNDYGTKLLAWVVKNSVMIDTFVLTKALAESEILAARLLNYPSSGIKTLVLVSEIPYNMLNLGVERSFEDVLRNCKGVTEIVCCHAVRTKHYQLIGELASSLTSIKLSTGIDANGMTILANTLTNLTKLELGINYELKYAAYLFFSLRGPQLLQLVGPWSDTRGIAAMCRIILQNCPNLRSWRMAAESHALAVLVDTPTMCRHLTDMRLTCTGINDTSLAHVTVLSSLLTELNFNRCTVADADVAWLLSRCARLRKVGFNVCGKVGTLTAAALAEHCPALRSLGIRCVLHPIGALQCVVSGRLNLLALDLDGSKIGDSALTTVLRHCSQLLELRITGCDSLTDVCIVQLPVWCPELVMLAMAEPETLVTIEGLRAVILECRHLRHVLCAHRFKEGVVRALREAGRYRVDWDRLYQDP
jgi:hypothetical protein